MHEHVAGSIRLDLVVTLRRGEHYEGLPLPVPPDLQLRAATDSRPTLWRELVPQNVPGLPDKSWRHKFRMALEEAQADGGIRRTLTNVNARRTAS